LLSILGRLVVTIGILLIATMIVGFVFSELYLRDWVFLSFGILAFFILKEPRSGKIFFLWYDGN